jgi:hypothetical protein
MKDRGCLGCLVVLILTALAVGWIGYRAYRWESDAKQPVEVIEAEILAATPLGSDISYIQKYVKSRWGGNAEPEYSTYNESQPQKIVSAKYGAYCDPVGRIWLIFCVSGTNVYVNWYFDKDDKLESVRVVKVHIVL